MRDPAVCARHARCGVFALHSHCMRTACPRQAAFGRPGQLVSGGVQLAELSLAAVAILCLLGDNLAQLSGGALLATREGWREGWRCRWCWRWVRAGVGTIFV